MNSQAEIPFNPAPSDEDADIPSTSSESDISEQLSLSPHTKLKYEVSRERREIIKRLISPQPSPVILESREGGGNPYWWPYSQHIVFEECVAFQPLSLRKVKFVHSFLKLDDLQIPCGSVIDKRFVSALAGDIMKHKRLLPYHGFITIRAAAHPPHLKVYAKDFPPYEVSDGAHLMFALDLLIETKRIVHIDKLLCMTTGITIGQKEPVNGSSHLCNVLIQASFDSIRMPGLCVPDPTYENKITRWITNNPLKNLGTYGRIIVLHEGAGKFTVQQGIPVVRAVRNAKHLLNGGKTSLPVTIVDLE